VVALLMHAGEIFLSAEVGTLFALSMSWCCCSSVLWPQKRIRENATHLAAAGRPTVPVGRWWRRWWWVIKNGWECIRCTLWAVADVGTACLPTLWLCSFSIYVFKCCFLSPYVTFISAAWYFWIAVCS